MCLYFSKQVLSSWMEVNQFNGNFLAPGNATKHHQPDVLNVPWGLPGAAEAVGFKSVLLDHPQQPRHAQNQPQREPGKQDGPGGSQSQEARGRREGRTRYSVPGFLDSNWHFCYFQTQTCITPAPAPAALTPHRRAAAQFATSSPKAGPAAPAPQNPGVPASGRGRRHVEGATRAARTPPFPTPTTISTTTTAP